VMVQWRRQSQSQAGRAVEATPLLAPMHEPRINMAGVESRGQAGAGAEMPPVRKVSIAVLLNG